MLSSIHSRPFGVLPTGESVEAWTLTGAGGLVLETISYGGIVTRLLAPDRYGHLDDLVLGYATLDAYVDDRCYFGAITGRVAGRITAGRFRLDGKLYSLTPNQPPNHLHGGITGFNKKVWAATSFKRQDGAPSIRFSRMSPDGEEGYPGNVDVSVTYTVTNDNVFLIETEASTDRATPFTLTHHSYFNLAGEDAGSIAEHDLQINADEFVPTDQDMTLLGRIESVDSKGNDFRNPQRLGIKLPLLFQSHGDLYRIRNGAPQASPSSPVSAARLVDPHSGRTLTVSTTFPYLQLYTAAALDGSVIGKSGAYPRHAGVCLECQGYPDGPNHPELGDSILRPGQPERHTTAYAFSCESLTRPIRTHERGNPLR